MQKQNKYNGDRYDCGLAGEVCIWGINTMKRGRDTPMEGIYMGKDTHDKRHTQGSETHRGYIRGKDTHGAKLP